MPMSPRRKSDAARRANQVVRSRTMLIMIILGICPFLILGWKLYDLQINQHEAMQEKAVNQQTRETTVTANRGSIYDRNGYVMAASATAETIMISPLEIAAFVDSQKESIEEAKEKAEAKGETYTAPAVLDQAYIARGLSRILGLEQSEIEKRMEKTYSQYEVLKKKVEQPVADEVRRFINGEIDEEGNVLAVKNEEGALRLISNPRKSPTRLQGVFVQPDSKRYYPYSSLAANVLGFVNAENVGGVGLEAKYDDALAGTSGLTVTAKNARGTEMLYQYEQYYDAENGHDLVLTIDVEVQSYLEKGIEGMVKKYDAKNGGTGIIMEVNTGAIIAMASYPNYDLNEPGMVHDTKLQEKLDSTLADLEKNRGSYATEEEYQAAVSAAETNALQTQWRNKCIDSTYEPGSTFKPITLAVGLEEGLVDLSSTFECSGSTMVQGWYKPFHCAKRAGHGHQTLKEAVGNSCNPAFINIGLRIGTETYYEYLKAFGLMEETGVDMIGEAKGIFADEKNFNSNVVSLASYAFGQTFNVTPLELIRAQAACINGGYLYTPYVVEQALDEEGNVTYQHDATPVRQVISEETSAIVRECLEYVVAEGGGTNGQVVGYRIGGKTGTADKTGTKTDDNPKGDVVVSFMCFAPADDPQYIMLLTMDTPSRDTGTLVYGGTMVAPVASTIMADVLPALGIEPDYTAEELAGLDAAVPNVVGETAESAKQKLQAAGFACRTVGSGEHVTDQTPAGGAIVPNNAAVVLYLGEEKPDAPCVVPKVVGQTASQVNESLTNAGLIMKAAGMTSGSAGTVRAISQSAAEGTEVPAGTVITIQFGDTSVTD